MLVCLLFLFSGCRQGKQNPNRDITMEAFSDLKTPAFDLSSRRIRENIVAMCVSNDSGRAEDKYIRSYYQNGGVFLWIDRYGVDERADTLLAFLRTVDDIGFSRGMFFVDVMECDLKLICNLDFNGTDNNINKVMARLEYCLTVAFMRYSTGHYFGFVNPMYIFNRLDTIADTPAGRPVVYKRLFDIDILRPGKEYFAAALRHIYNDSVGEFLQRSQPEDTLYYVLKRKLKTATEAERMKIVCNMERLRWREVNGLDTTGKYIVVNIPAFHLYAFGGSESLDMMVGCGARKTKTPLLSSEIERMEVNPIWNIPVSIIKNEVAHHAGDADYFERNRYNIIERESGDLLDPEEVTVEMLKSGRYRVAQEGGEGNSMGRIVFRFPNQFSVFLHDTSSRSVFSRAVRSVSHGCVRVQKPFDLAAFLLDEPDEWLLDKLRISMDIKPETERGIKYIKNPDNKTKLVSGLKVQPRVPLLITYYTIYPNEKGVLSTYPDIYGYDDVIGAAIKPFMK